MEWLEHHSVRVRRGSNNKAFLAAHPDITPIQFGRATRYAVTELEAFVRQRVVGG
ncbi:MAG: hypothetical protein WCP59_15405 [Actinomycetota bacterium]